MPRSDKLESLQIGRGVAALLVMLVHATTFVRLNYHETFAGNLFIAGSAGVDFFFVLSGFIIWHRHARDIGQPERVADYGWRRLVRIYPAYWIVILAILPAYFLVPRYGLGDETSPYIITTSLLLVPAYRPPILVAGWTLIHELWFYLLFAGLIAFRGRWFRWVVGLWVAGVAGFVSALWNSRLLAADPWLRTVLSPVNFEFVLGCLAAWLVSHPRLQRSTPRMWCAVLLAGGLAFTTLMLVPALLPGAFLGNRVLGFGLSAFFIVLGAAGWDLSTRTGQAAGSTLTRGPVFLGDASYSLYLLHGPVLSATCKLAVALGLVKSWGANTVGWLAVIASVVTACAFHRWIERPLLHWLRSRRSNQAENPAPEKSVSR